VGRYWQRTTELMIVFFQQLDAQIRYFNTFITFFYMFRAPLCSSSGGQIVLTQHLVTSLSLGDCSVHRLRQDESPLVTCVLISHPKPVTIPDAVLINCPPEDENNSARNMYRNVTNVLK